MDVEEGGDIPFHCTAYQLYSEKKAFGFSEIADVIVLAPSDKRQRVWK